MWPEPHTRRDAALDAAPPAVSLRPETLDSLDALRRAGGLRWPAPFVLPGWTRAWHETFGKAGLRLLSIRGVDGIIGAAPLQVDGRTASLVGSPDVCDHLDLAAAPGREQAVCRALIEHLRGSEAVDRLELGPFRPDSIVALALLPAARELGLPAAVSPDEELFELALPSSWDDYLAALSGKERHEVRRKLRRGGESFHFELTAGRADAVEEFLRLFRRNRMDKAAFMDGRMEEYFRRLAEHVPETRIGLLRVDGSVAAAVWCVDHGRTRYLYNSGYDADYSGLSVGLACKLLSIRDAIERGLTMYDFLKGNETYKRRLGGVPVALVRCRIDLRQPAAAAE
jgi:CelD/BcsL family acetyltransferase involved in cellulose biosynthesis